MQFMTGPQLETALPTLAAKDIRASVQFMVVNVSAQSPPATLYLAGVADLIWSIACHADPIASPGYDYQQSWRCRVQGQNRSHRGWLRRKVSPTSSPNGADLKHVIYRVVLGRGDVDLGVMLTCRLDTRLLPVDQKFVYGAIQSAQGKGINLRNLKAVLAGKNITIPPMVMKKLLQGLEKQGFIKSFTAINVCSSSFYKRTGCR
jgi:hypothetical protein